MSIGTTFGNQALAAGCREIIRHSCVPTIANNVRLLGTMGVKIIICTWSSEGPELIAAVRMLNPDAVVLVLDEPESPTVPVSERNKFLQFYSTLEGIKVADELGCGLVFKIRTDQEIDFPRLFEFVQRRGEYSDLKNVLIVPFLQQSDPFFFLDFYFGGTLQVMRKFCEMFLSYGRMSLYPNIHQDAFLKLALTLLPRLSGRLPSAFFSDVRPPKCQFQVDVAVEMWRNHVIPAPQSIYLSMVWRGRRPFPSLDYGGLSNLIFSDPLATPDLSEATLSAIEAWSSHVRTFEKHARWYSGATCWYRYFSAKWGRWPGVILGGTLDAPFALKMYVRGLLSYQPEGNSQRQRWLGGIRR